MWAILISVPSEIEGRVETDYLLMDLYLPHWFTFTVNRATAKNTRLLRLGGSQPGLIILIFGCLFRKTGKDQQS
ncbi:MAG: hypothetical protein KAS71_14600 [Bacteroidales bacterium]|nr:hypothetical protein [Bacteroidales bacterium]